MNGSKIGIGVIGCGGIAQQKHLPALKENKSLCDIVAFCNPMLERAKKAKAEYGTKESNVYRDHHDVLEDDRVGAVYVLTPAQTHSEICVDAFWAGKHVLCEKPMADHAESAKEVLEAWRKSGKQFTIGCQKRYLPQAIALHKICRSGALGEIYYVKVQAIRRRGIPAWGGGGVRGSEWSAYGYRHPCTGYGSVAAGMLYGKKSVRESIR